MARLLIVYHSQSGATETLMHAVLQGAELDGSVEIRMLRAMEATVSDLLWCEAVIFGSPENLGYLSGGMKDFFDRTFYPAQDAAMNLPYSVVISAGNDGSGALRQLQRIVLGYPMRCVTEPLILTGEVNEDYLAKCRELGEAMAAGMSMGIF